MQVAVGIITLLDCHHSYHYCKWKREGRKERRKGGSMKGDIKIAELSHIIQYLCNIKKNCSRCLYSTRAEQWLQRQIRSLSLHSHNSVVVNENCKKDRIVLAVWTAICNTVTPRRYWQLNECSVINFYNSWQWDIGLLYTWREREREREREWKRRK